MKESSAFLLAAFIAVGITLVSTRFWVLISRALALVFRKADESLTRRLQTQAEHETLLELGSLNANDSVDEAGTRSRPFILLPILSDLTELRTRSHSDIGFSLRLLRDVRPLLCNLRKNGSEITVKLTVCAICLVVFVTATVVGVLSSNVVLDSVVLCSSSECGWYVAGYCVDVHNCTGTNSGQEDLLARFMLDKETAAAAHGTRCYRGEQSPQDCDGLYAKAISYKTMSNSSCPFDGDVCSQGSNSAFTMDTGLLDASILGLNTKRSWTFQRKTTCAPLITDEPYIRPCRLEDGTPCEMYDYGRYPIPSNRYPNYTFVKKVNIPELYNNAYKGYILDIAAEDMTWEALPEFKSEHGSSSIFIVSGYGLVYPQRSDDPVFPAQEPVPNFEGNQTWWENNQNHAGVFGCVDFWQVCDEDLVCWNSRLDWNEVIKQFRRENSPDRCEEQIEMSFLGRIMLLSTMWNTVRIRKANALIAQQSIKLDPEQWKTEVEAMFRMSLAHIQNELVDIASGAWAHQDLRDMLEVFTLKDRNHLCHMVQARNSSMRGISVRGLVLIGLLSLAIVVLSINPDNELIVIQWLSSYLKKSVAIAMLGGRTIRILLRSQTNRWVYRNLERIWSALSRGGGITLPDAG